MFDKIINNYVDDILSGRRISCEYTRLAVERYINDIATGIDRGIFFNKTKAEKACKWFTYLNHGKGEWAGRPFNLEPWQAFITWNLFGWENADKTRRFNYAYIQLARKNGKSTYAAGTGMYMLGADGEPGAEIYSGATKKDQAKICFDEANNIIRYTPRLKSLFTVYRTSIVHELTGSFFKPLSSDYDTLDGLNSHMNIIDEYHAHKTADLYDVLSSGMGSRRQPLQLTITTAGFNRTSPCYTYRDVIIKILRGITPKDNTFGIIYELDENDDWKDSAVWSKSNPNFGISVKEKYIADEVQNAIINPSKEVNVKTKLLDTWCDALETWIPDEKWQACGEEYSLEDLRGLTATCGIDLSSNIDLTAASYVVDLPNGKKAIWCLCWIPESKLKNSPDNVDYELWSRQGHVRITEGETIDIDTVVKDIIEMHSFFNMQKTAIDRAKAYHGVSQGLQKEGLELIPFGQGFISMDAPTKEFYRMVFSKELINNGSPLLRWTCSNIAIKKDEAENIKIDKKKSIGRVDPMVATVMAVGIKMANDFNNINNDYYAKNDLKCS